MPKHKDKDMRQTIPKDEMSGSSSKGILTGVAIIAILIILAVLLPYKTVASTEQVPYQAKEEYVFQEPYSEVEKSTKSVPYQAYDCTYRVPVYSVAYEGRTAGSNLNVSCIITSHEGVPVEFQYTIYTSSRNDSFDYSSGPKGIVINPYETGRVDALLASRTYFGCRVKPQILESCGQVTKYNNVTEEKKVTKYRDAVKTKESSKMRADTIYTQVNWLFGKKFPWHREWKVEGAQKDYYRIGEV